MTFRLSRWLGAVTLLTLLLTAMGFAPIETSTSAQSEERVYVVVMAQDPVVTYDGGVPGLQPTKPGVGGKINPNSSDVRQYVAYLDLDFIHFRRG